MSRRSSLLFAALLGSLGVLVSPIDAIARTPLTSATVRNVRNTVRLTPKGRSARSARRSDRMRPGDALATGRSSFAELGFNDGSLARLGERVVFRFVPRTRTFRLSNGTALVLIPPGRGRTRVKTPNATAGIRGSGLFVQYQEETDTTLVGALTTSGIEVCSQEELLSSQVETRQEQPTGALETVSAPELGSPDEAAVAEDCLQGYELQGGQLAVITGDRVQGIYEFDLRTFYETSQLVDGLQLDEPLSDADTTGTEDPTALVRLETLEALADQAPFASGPASSAVSGQTLPTPDALQAPGQGLDELFDAGEQLGSRPGSEPGGPVAGPNPGTVGGPVAGPNPGTGPEGPGVGPNPGTEPEGPGAGPNPGTEPELGVGPNEGPQNAPPEATVVER